VVIMEEVKICSPFLRMNSHIHRTSKPRPMKTLSMIARILLGLMMLIFGLNKFFHFIPMEMPSEGPAFDYFMALSSVKLMTIVGGLEVICGILLLVKKYVALAAVILAAILFNAVLFHLMLDPGGSAGGILALVFNIIVLYAERERLSGLFEA